MSTFKCTRRCALLAGCFLLALAGFLGLLTDGGIFTPGYLSRLARQSGGFLRNPAPAAPAAFTLPESEPRRLRIPALAIDAGFEEPHLGLDENREIEIPESYTDVGWYKYGPTPGELGPAIVLGHVDSFEGAAVFYALGQLKEGDRVEVEREDGATAVFAVDRLARYDQSNFPTEEVYGNTRDAQIRLITCTGTYDKQTKRYSKNLVVYATLVEE